jgi:hypothetical protein
MWPRRRLDRLFGFRCSGRLSLGLLRVKGGGDEEADPLAGSLFGSPSASVGRVKSGGDEG